MTRKIPLAIYLLGLAIFAQGTSELIASGLLPIIATDLDVSVADAGMLTSGFAIGMAVGAPVLAIVTLRWAPRPTLLGLLTAFVIMHIAGALAPNFTVLLTTRIAGAFGYAGFWAVATVTALRLVSPDVKGKALAIVAGGLTIASVVGVPAGTLIGQHFGWRAALWTVAAGSAAVGIGLLAVLPAGRGDRTGRPRLRTELRNLTNSRLWITYLTGAMTSGTFTATFTYAAALLVSVSGLTAGWVPVVLAATGIGGLIGITLGGRTADARPYSTLLVGFGGATAAALLLAFFPDSGLIAIVTLIAMSAFTFAANPAVNVRVFTLAAQAPTLASAANVVAFNAGITAGPWLSALAIGAGLGLGSVAWVSVSLGAIGIAAAVAGRRLGDRPETEPVRPQAMAA